MVKKHLKRHATPKTWQIKRKGITFITRPNPGAHSMGTGISMNLLLKVMGHAKTTMEVKRLLQSREVLVDGKRVTDQRFMAGLMDVVSIPSTGKNYRIVLGKGGKITFIEIDSKESMLKPCKVTGKTMIKGGKLQINLFDGKNIISEKGDCLRGDTLVIEMPKNTVKEKISLEKGAYILLTAGKHIADRGVVEGVQKNKVIYKSESGKTTTTLREYAFAIGREKPAVAVDKK